MLIMLTYLLELRLRACYIAGVFICFLMLFFCFANALVLALLTPLLHRLPSTQSLVAIDLISPIVTPLSLAFHAATLCTTPFALLQLWLFIAPALYPHEKTRIRSGIIASMVLFIVGLCMGYTLVLPLLFTCIIQTVPSGVQLMPDMANAVGFMLRMLWICGLLFQVPLLCTTSAAMGWISPDGLKRIRPYVITGAFILGMLLTPPDVLSQIVLAIPLCLLYELGILGAIYTLRTKKTSNATNTISPTPNNPIVRKL